MKKSRSAKPGARRWYRCLLLLYPRSFRRRWGPDIVRFLSHQRREPRYAAGAFGAFRCFWDVLGDAVANGISLRTANVVDWLRGRRYRMNRSNRGPGRVRTGDGIVGGFLTDMHHAVRMLRKRPVFAVATVATLGLGIGSNTAIFSVAHGVLMRPLPYQAPERLVELSVSGGSSESRPAFYGLSDPEFADLRRESNSFEQIAGYHGGEVTIGDSLSARRVPVMRVTADMLPMLGVPPLLGRFFSAEEDTRHGSRAIVLSYGLWQRQFGGDSTAVGRTILLENFDAAFAAPFNQPVPIVGVMPAGFEFPDPQWEAWVPFGLDLEDPVARNNHYIEVVARLKRDVTLPTAQSELNVLAVRSTEDHPDVYPQDRGLTFRLRKYHARIVEHVVTPIYLLLTAVGVLLLAACINVANILLTQGEARRHEMAIRTAVGASTGRVTRQLVTENILLGTLGGLAGLAVAYWGVSILLTIALQDLPRLNQIGIDGSVLGFSILLSIGAGMVFGILPALQTARTDLRKPLAAGGGTHGGGRSPLVTRRLLVISQVAFAVLLVAGAGLMLRSMRNIYSADPGIRTENVLTFQLDPAADTYRTPESRIGFYSDLIARLEHVPGVLSVGAAHSLPLGIGGTNLSIEIEGQPVATLADAPLARVQFVTPEYFEAMGLTLIRGRFFTRHDDARSTPVVVVTEAMASAHWPDDDPVGQRMRMYGRRWMEVVGVIKDVYHFGVHRDPGTWWYVPHAQGYVSSYTSPRQMHVVALTDSDPTALVGTIRAAVAGIDPNTPMSRIRSMADSFDASVENERFLAVLFSVFAGVALALAVVGVHGVVSLTVARQTREIGIRMALGAMSANLLVWVMREALMLSVVGVTLGLTAGIVLSRALETMVFGVMPTDPLTYAGVSLLVTTATGVAAFVPARRATRVDPVDALQQV